MPSSEIVSASNDVLKYDCLCMGDKSPKEAHKKDVQKHAKDEAAEREKHEHTQAQHHPTSGHTATPSHPTTSDEPVEKTQN
jgi:hypothetical protein